jgi:type II secretory pathway pseudopilin PulG
MPGANRSPNNPQLEQEANAKLPVAGLATVSLVLGIFALPLALVIVGGIVGIGAVICGHLARKKIKDSQEPLGGAGRAKGGLIMGYIAIGILILWFPVALMATIAVPSFVRARKRSQATKVVNDARFLSAAIDQWAIENNLSNDTPVDLREVLEYVPEDNHLHQSRGADIFGARYDFSTVAASVTVNQSTYNALSDVTNRGDFWGAYAPDPAAATSSGGSDGSGLKNLP